MNRLSQLRENLDARFSLEELETLCFDLGIDAENVPGKDKGKEYFIQEMLTYLGRRGRLPQLVEACKLARPDWNLEWNQAVPKPTPPALPKTSRWRIITVLGLAAIVVGAGVLQIIPMLRPKSRCPDGMILIAGGVFRMGAAPGDQSADDDEKPSRDIQVDAFCMDRTEISNEQFARWTKTTPPAERNFPVVNVSWEQANGYCRSLGRHLPTEAQWERAARGPNSLIYSWGDEWDGARANSGETRPRGLRPVDAYPLGASREGILNMAGNAAEWVADWYAADWYGKMPNKDVGGPLEPTDANEKKRVVRGGSFVHGPASLRTSARIGVYSPDTQLDFLGFRCAAQPAR